MRQSNCPDATNLQQFAWGRLGQSATDEVGDHVEDCSICQAALGRFENESDPLAEDLRSLASLSKKPADSVPLLDSCNVDLSDLKALGIDHGRALVEQLAEGQCQIGMYLLIEELGVGSFGHVFKAYDAQNDRIVALKVERHSLPPAAEVADRFEREARAIAELQHDGVVELLETGRTEGGVRFIVNEFVDGVTLETEISRKRISQHAAVTLASGIADALDATHRKGVIHRDLKPSNILLDAEGTPHVTDFGLARFDSAEATLTSPGEIMGTPAYMSPEQARGDGHHADPRSDVYSLGVILYEMLTGERPYQGNRRMILLQVLEGEPPEPRRLDATIPAELQAVCLKAMAARPEDRYQSAAEFTADLQRFLRGEPVNARPPIWSTRLKVWCSKNPAAASILAGVTVGSLFGFMYLSSLSRWFVQQSALESVRLQTDAIEQFNTLYSEGAARLAPGLVGTTKEYESDEKPILFPASFTIEAGRRMGCVGDGLNVQLFSNHPFPWRGDGGPRDQFQIDALEALSRNPTEPFYRFEELEGQPFLRYATARVMTESCVQCHNSHPKTPKDDWTKGDVRGVLEITHPMIADEQRIASGMRGAFLLVGALAAGLTSLAFAILLRTRRGRGTHF